MKPLKARVVDAERYWIAVLIGKHINIASQLFGAPGDLSAAMALPVQSSFTSGIGAWRA
jgi:hypothetical protein